MISPSLTDRCRSFNEVCCDKENRREEVFFFLVIKCIRWIILMERLETNDGNFVSKFIRGMMLLDDPIHCPNILSNHLISLDVISPLNVPTIGKSTRKGN